MKNMKKFIENDSFLPCYESQIESFIFRKFICEHSKCNSKECIVIAIHYDEKERKINVIVECTKCHNYFRVTLLLRTNFEKIISTRLSVQAEIGETLSLVDAFFFAIQYTTITITELMCKPR
ncbi:MAG: hypothetical protein RR290_03615 [Clostridia bacterium]